MKTVKPASINQIEHIPRPIVTIAKHYETSHAIERHNHFRVQFLYAKQGLMSAQTDQGSWIVPLGYGLLIPSNLEHSVWFHGAADFQSVYMMPDRINNGPDGRCRVIKVTPLLKELINRFADLPNVYAETGHDHHLTELLIHEIDQSPSAKLALPYPKMRALRTVCDAMIANVATQKSIDDWAYDIGMSRRSFTRSFRDETNLSFDAWRQRLRHQTALILLAQGQSMQTVAASVGYGTAGALKTMMARLT